MNQHGSYKTLEGTQFLISDNQIIGRGMFGVVTKAIDTQKPTQKLCAKIIPLDGNHSMDSISSQLQILRQLPSHPNLVNTRKLQITSQNNFYLIMQYCNQGSFQKFMKQNPNISEVEIWQLVKQFCRGYQVLYDNKLIHRDIKPDNILMHNGQIKISDFGLSRKVLDTKITLKLSAKGTPFYMAPQLQFHGEGSSKVDVFSLGVVLFRLSFHGQYPFGSNYRTSTQYFSTLMQKQIIFPKTPKRSKQLIQLITKMLQKQSKNRISWQQIFQHPKIDINKFEGSKIFSSPIAHSVELDSEQQKVPSTLSNRRSITKVNYLPNRINFREQSMFKTEQLLSFQQCLSAQFLNEKLQRMIFRGKVLCTAIQFVNKKFQSLINQSLHPFLRKRLQNLMKIGYQQCLWIYQLISEQISQLKSNIYVNKMKRMITNYKNSIIQSLDALGQAQPQQILLASVRQQYPQFLYIFLTQFPDYPKDLKDQSRSMVSILIDIYDSASKFNFAQFYYEKQTLLDQIDIGLGKNVYEYFNQREKDSFEMIEKQLMKYGLLVI